MQEHPTQGRRRSQKAATWLTIALPLPLSFSFGLWTDGLLRIFKLVSTIPLLLQVLPEVI